MTKNVPIQEIVDIGTKAGFSALAVCFYDYARSVSFDHQGDRFFHAASTYKAAILLALYDAAAQGAVRLQDFLHVRNRFISVADGSVFRTNARRDGEPAVYRSVGRCLRLSELARGMIVRSSNLATNLLLDHLGVERVQEFLRKNEIGGIRILRGVEDDKAFEQGLNNEVTAEGLVQLYRLLCSEHFLDETMREEMRQILFAQEFNRMIPAQLPGSAEVAHKTGEISTVCHDAGLIFTPNAPPYALAILTEATETIKTRKKAVAAISRLIFKFLRPEEAAAA